MKEHEAMVMQTKVKLTDLRRLAESLTSESKDQGFPGYNAPMLDITPGLDRAIKAMDVWPETLEIIMTQGQENTQASSLEAEDLKV